MTTKNPNLSYESLTRLERRTIRADQAENTLLKDIEAWKQVFTPDSLIQTHINQFGKFCQTKLDHFRKGHGKLNQYELDLKVILIGALNNQWGSLRHVAEQHLTGTPYHKDLIKLNQETDQYYHRIYQALPPSLQDKLTSNTPLVYLGHTAELTLFNNENLKAPALISVPVGAIYDPYSRLAIAHETGHAVFSRIPEFIPQVVAKVQACLDTTYPNSDPQTRILRQTMLGWMDEIIADLVGISLVGSDYIESSLYVMAVSESEIETTDSAHPPAVLRPQVSLNFLKKYLQSQISIANVAPIEGRVTAFIASSSIADRYFRSFPAISTITLKDVLDEMNKVIDCVVKTEISEKVSLLDVLVNCATSKTPDKESEVTNKDLNWGEISFEDDAPFFLDLTNMLPPEFTVPMVFSDLWCKLAPWTC